MCVCLQSLYSFLFLPTPVTHYSPITEEEIDPQQKSDLLTLLPKEIFLEIAIKFNARDLIKFRGVCKKIFNLTQSEKLPSIFLIERLALKIRSITNDCPIKYLGRGLLNDCSRDTTQISEFSVQINDFNDLNDILISNETIDKHKIPLDRVDFKFIRELTNPKSGLFDLFLEEEITMDCDLKSLELTEINEEIDPVNQNLISMAIDLAKPLTKKNNSK